MCCFTIALVLFLFIYFFHPQHKGQVTVAPLPAAGTVAARVQMNYNEK